MIVTASLLPEIRRRAHEEADLQHAAMAFLDRCLPPDAVAHHSPGEGQRTRRAQRDLRRSGYKTGWPDIEIVARGFPHIFIELKVRGRGLSPEQKDMQRRLIYCGAVVLLCRSVECIECALRELGVPLRGRVAA